MENRKDLLFISTVALVIVSCKNPSLPIRIALAGCAAALTAEIILDIRRRPYARNDKKD